MKVFISWSGQSSHRVATVLRDWLPSVIQSVVPYVSSEDIDKGARWSTDIAGELSQSAFGILCVTPDNVSAPWLNFEAGALGKSVDKSRVCPFLFRIKRSQVEGPILQFQSTVCERDDVLKLLRSINSSAADQSIEEARLDKIFDVWWPSLKKELDTIPDETPAQETQEKKHVSPGVHMERILEEILELSRLNQKLLRSPDELLPPAYLEKVLRRPMPRERGYAFDHPVFLDLVASYRKLSTCFEVFWELNKKGTASNEVRDAIREMAMPLRFIVGHLPADKLDLLPAGTVRDLEFLK